MKKLSEKIEEKMAALEQTTRVVVDLAVLLTKRAAEDAQKAMKAQLDGLIKEKHDGLVGEVFKARVDAGVAGKEDEEKAMLAAFDDKMLLVMKADALKVAQLVQTHESSGPKTRFGNRTAGTDLKAAIDEQRVKMGFSARTTQPKESE